ncbi:uncharacterized protein LAESUDRAFT_645450 [Laetiporus sulphureus 93-53]|uniref:Uncharacterized protein n=1 Tax=Laetiporus sulphureus 93-53 TaxID=1314785 RepID=A0A165GAN4_9APHY|nr:uncharacterized protein LAESUDRAFT_645450 [Laetiporus sulphureus 93-53]KZT10078.1 hypothetical protein LAESUDRAFT_645450 [Laetiporus sulphureus 93-53]
MVYVSLTGANMGTVAVESFLYGIFLLLSSTYIYLHTNRVSNESVTFDARWRKFLTPLFMSAILITTTATAHWILTVVRFFQAFVLFEGGAAPELFYADLSQTTEVVKTAFLISTLIISDIMFAYRLWIVWSYNFWVVMVPALAVTGLCVSGIGIVYELTRLSTADTVFVSQAAHWITADYSFTFITNVYSSCLIAWKVWRSSRKASAYGGGQLMRVLATIVESAGTYTLYVIVFFAAYESGSNLQYPFVDTLCQVAAIAFMMINVRVGLGWAQKAHQTHSTSSNIIPSRRNGDQSFIMRPVAVDITRVVQKEDDMGQPIKRASSDYSSSPV